MNISVRISISCVCIDDVTEFDDCDTCYRENYYCSHVISIIVKVM